MPAKKPPLREPTFEGVPHVRWPKADPGVLATMLEILSMPSGGCRGIDECIATGPCGEIRALHSADVTKLASLSESRVAKLAKALPSHEGAAKYVPALCALAVRADDEGLGLYVWSSDPECSW